MVKPDIRQIESEVMLPVYRRLPGVFVRGEGCTLWDEDGKSYIDLLAGLAVNALGHAHPALVETISRQAGTLMHTGNSLVTEPQVLLAEQLCQLLGADKVFFTNDGTGAMETALKIAKKYGHQHGKPEIVSLKGGFHGRTLGSISVTHQPRHQDPFLPLLPGCIAVEPNNLEDLRNKVGPQTSAIVFEPISGEGGVLPLTGEFQREARKLATEFGALLIVDEIQTGMGRTGTWLALQHHDITPDIVCIAKALGCGFPIGACLTWPVASHILGVGEHGSTFGGNPLACSVGLTVLRVMQESRILEKVAERGAELEAGLKALPGVTEVRGAGLMRGATLAKPIAREVVVKSAQEGVLINATDERTLRFLPPLVVSSDELKTGLSRVRAAIESVGA